MGYRNWESGEWTGDTSMAIPILRELAAGADPLDTTTQDHVVTAWRDWAATAPDVGIQTSRVLSALTEPTASAALASARRVHQATGRSAGNGSLMRTAPLALAYLSDREGASKTGDAARTFSDLTHFPAPSPTSLSNLTHFEDSAGDACVIWTLAIREAILTGVVRMDDAIVTFPPNAKNAGTGSSRQH